MATPYQALTPPSTMDPRSGSGPAVESAVTRLLVSIKALLESLTKWSEQQISDMDVSDVYVRLGNNFNAVVAAFAAYNIEMKELHSVPEDLRNILETCLAEDARPENLQRYLPDIRGVITKLLQGLRGKQTAYRKIIAEYKPSSDASGHSRHESRSPPNIRGTGPGSPSSTPPPRHISTNGVSSHTPRPQDETSLTFAEELRKKLARRGPQDLAVTLAPVPADEPRRRGTPPRTRRTEQADYRQQQLPPIPPRTPSPQLPSLITSSSRRHNSSPPPPPYEASASRHGPTSVSSIRIAVMGATGSGKTSFINLASGSNLRVRMDLGSCTTEIQLADEFTLDGRTVTLIDTPGFNETSQKNTDILKGITAFLATTYGRGSTLSGVIYIHRIYDFRGICIAERDFEMLHELCGNTTLTNVVIVTNMWGEVSRDAGEALENELSRKIFKPALDRGAQMVRHHSTARSAHDVIRGIIGNRPVALQVERGVQKGTERPPGCLPMKARPPR